MSNNKTIQYGEELNSKIAEFEKALLLVQDKYQPWFNERKDVIGDKPDKLSMHYIIHIAVGLPVSFGFMPKSELPKYIQEECMEVFNQNFS